jgi:hypothetical protein
MMGMLEVIEDNGGGLALFVKDGENVVYGHNYDGGGKQIMDDIAAYINNPDTSGWEGNLDDPQEAYDDYKEYDEYGQYTGPQGWEVVYRYETPGTSTIFHSRMGVAAALLWGRER